MDRSHYGSVRDVHGCFSANSGSVLDRVGFGCRDPLCCLEVFAQGMGVGMGAVNLFGRLAAWNMYIPFWKRDYGSDDVHFSKICRSRVD